MPAGGIVNAITSVFRGIVNAITSVFRGIVNAITSVFRGIVNAITSVFRGIVNAITSVFRGIVNGHHQRLPGHRQRPSPAPFAASSTPSPAPSGASSTPSPAPSGASSTPITSAFRGIVNAITSAFRGIVNAITSTFRGIVNAIRGAVRATFQGIGRLFHRLRIGLDRMAFRFRATTLTLSVENGVVRAVAFKGRNVIAWTAASLEDPANQEEETGEPTVEDASAAPTGDTSPLRRLMQEMPARRSRLVTDMPIYAPLIRQLHLPKVSGRYRQQMILSEVLETIPFEPEEVDVSWQLRKDLEGEEAFAIAVPKGHVESQVGLIKEANLSPSAAYTKATALAFAVGIPDAIVVHLEQDRVATVLIHESTPQVVHQQDFPSTATDPREQADALAAAVDQVAGYYQARGPGSKSEPLPVVLTGQLPGNCRAENPCCRSYPRYWGGRYYLSPQR